MWDFSNAYAELHAICIIGGIWFGGALTYMLIYRKTIIGWLNSFIFFTSKKRWLILYSWEEKKKKRNWLHQTINADDDGDR